MAEQIGFMGLGALGLPIATNLLDSGYALTVYNRTASKADPLVKRGACLVSQPADTVTSGGVVVNVMWDMAAVESAVTSEGFLDRLGPGGIHISMCTGSPDGARRLAELHAKHGCIYVEAPVFGRPEAAEARKLWIPVSGPRAAKDRVQPLFTAMGAQRVFDFGEEIGSATMVKLAGNFLMISAVTSLREALTVTEMAGVDAKATLDMLTQTLFPSPIYQNYGTMIVEKQRALSQSAIPQKDLGLFDAVAQKCEFPAPVARTLLNLIQRKV
jgi:3-hydroxyisobutyrate dehydrogenase-like beta-hydroxyacid dehydrogenase